MFILKTGHQPGVYVPLRALFLVLPWKSIVDHLLTTMVCHGHYTMEIHCGPLFDYHGMSWSLLIITLYYGNPSWTIV